VTYSQGPNVAALLSPQLLNDIRQLLEQSRDALVQTVNSAMVQTYWHIGRLIVEDEQKGQSRADYGAQQIEFLAEKLQSEFGKGFHARNLRNMRQFYATFPIWNAVRTELSWTHYRVLMRLDNTKARDWYVNEAIASHWSARSLERQIGTLYYERLLSSKDKALVVQEAADNTKPLATHPKDFLRDPYVLDFLNLPHQSFLEKDIEQGIIDNITEFLLELGRGFAFVARQQRISIEDQDFYLDLVFYNFKLKCFLLVDLKLGKLNHADVGQMDTYVRIYDEQFRGVDDNPTIGLLLCSQKSQAVVKYSVLADSNQLFASKYLPYLPTEDELRRELERERNLIGEKQRELGGDREGSTS
jgi:predicted nuclease of restriction endonuclease-like (RecB) superfamily